MLAALLITPVLVTGITHVSIQNYSFVPDSVRIEPGDTVRWTQNDDEPHTSTGTGTGPGQWASGTLNKDQTYQRVFSAAGSYDYICDFHAMFGKVVVGNPASLRAVPVPEAGAAGAKGPPRDARGRLVGPGAGQNEKGAPFEKGTPTFTPR